MNVPHPVPPPEEPIVDLVPIVRRVVAARVADPVTRDDIVQETLARVMASRSRVEHESLVPYAITTARNLIASLVQREQRARRNAHLLAEADEPEPRHPLPEHERHEAGDQHEHDDDLHQGEAALAAPRAVRDIHGLPRFRSECRKRTASPRGWR